MLCPECQFDNRQGVQFCEECGTKLELKCPNCKTIIPLARKFCGKCWSPLKKFTESANLKESNTDTQAPQLPAEKNNYSESSTDGERKHVTVLFSDLSGYTSMSEKLDPEEVKEITSRIFREISRIVGNYDGFVEKYAGDAVMAIFGAPQAHEDDPVQRFNLGKGIFKCSKKIQCFQLLIHMAGSSVKNSGEAHIIKILRSLQEKSSVRSFLLPVVRAVKVETSIISGSAGETPFRVWLLQM